MNDEHKTRIERLEAVCNTGAHDFGSNVSVVTREDYDEAMQTIRELALDVEILEKRNNQLEYENGVLTTHNDIARDENAQLRVKLEMAKGWFDRIQIASFFVGVQSATRHYNDLIAVNHMAKKAQIELRAEPTKTEEDVG